MDSLDTINTLLEADWNNDNTDSITPTIGKVFDFKRIDLRFGESKDYILNYHYAPYSSVPSGIGVAKKRTTDSISIDIRTMISRSHGIKVRDEVERILDANILNPSSEYQLLNPDKTCTDLSDKSIGLWRFVWDVQLKNFAVGR